MENMNYFYCEGVAGEVGGTGTPGCVASGAGGAGGSGSAGGGVTSPPGTAGVGTDGAVTAPFCLT